MAIYLVKDGVIQGTSEQTDNLPNGYEAVEGIDADDVSFVYFDGEEIKLKPPKPSDISYWDLALKDWVTPTDTQAPLTKQIKVADWQKFTDGLRGSSSWAKVFEVATVYPPAAAVFTVLSSSITVTHNIDDLLFSINAMRNAMKQTQLGDFNEQQIFWLNALFAECGFDVVLS